MTLDHHHHQQQQQQQRPDETPTAVIVRNADAGEEGKAAEPMGGSPSATTFRNSIVRPMLCELAATFLLGFIMDLKNVRSQQTCYSWNALVEGFTILILVAWTLSVSRGHAGHLNPAITLCEFLVGPCRWPLLLGLLFVQLWGFLLGSLLAVSFLPRTPRELASSAVADVSPLSVDRRFQAMALELVLTSFVCVAYREASPTSSPHHYHYHHRRLDEGHHSRRSLHSLPFVAAVSKALTSALFLPIYGLYLLQSCNFSQALATAIVAKAFDADGYGMRDDSQLTYFYLDLLAALFGAILAAALCRSNSSFRNIGERQSCSALTWLRAADTATNR